MISKSYKDLEKVVWDEGLCSGCGGCSAVCPANSLYFDIEAESDRPLATGYCKAEVDGVPCGACYEVCPRKDPAPSELMGEYISINAAKAEFDIGSSQSGGAVTAILSNALDEGLLDAVITVKEDPWTLEPTSCVVTSTDVLMTHAGSRYNWWLPFLSSLKEAVMTRKCESIAIIGVPCVVQAIRKMRQSEHDLIGPFRDSIKMVMGLFCTESFDHGKLVEGKLKKEYSIEPWQISRLDVSGKLDLTLKDGSTSSIPLEELDDCVRPGCKVCTDFTALDSDISAGSVGSPQGFTTLIVRTQIGRMMVDNAISNNKLSLSEDVNLDIIEKLAKKKMKRMPSDSRKA